MPPQTFHVLLCHDCKTFQVDIVKKSTNKWSCKVCNSKQSVQQVYAKGTGAECRGIVQKLNEARGRREEALASVAQAQIEQETSHLSEDISYVESLDDNFDCPSSSRVPTTSLRTSETPGIQCVPPEKSKWTVFLE